MVSFAHAQHDLHLTAATGDRDLQLRLRAWLQHHADRSFLSRYYRQNTAKASRQLQLDDYEQRMKNHLPTQQETKQWLDLFQKHAAAKKR